tara:strand:- start:292 stop:402 length:111 start_codon:yes stop_codon:yes gene_type:complete
MKDPWLFIFEAIALGIICVITYYLIWFLFLIQPGGM